jgi:adenylate cyclase
MGVFGVPLKTMDHATRALRAALEMRDRMVLLNETLEQRGLPTLSVGIGIHTGEVLIGTIGSRMRLDYTVIGDTVNTASRIEGLTRRYNVDILLSQETRRCLTSGATQG